jgi:nuclear transport factor 2 (NTF2) superfamily protein
MTDLDTPILEPRPPLPPFTRETATQKVRLAEDGWNSRDPEKVALAYIRGIHAGETERSSRMAGRRSSLFSGASGQGNWTTG